MSKTRQTNVNINYTVNTVDIERGNGLLAKASKATDDLRKSTDTYAKTASAGSQKVSTSIAGMTLQMQRLKSQIELTNKSDTKRLAQLSGQYKALKTQVDAYNKSLLETSRISKQTATSVQGVANQFGEVYTAMKLVFSAGILKELFNMSLEMNTLAGKIEGVSRAFDLLPNSTTLLNSLQKATHGTVTDIELMQKALQASNFRIPLEKLGTLFEFAAAKAQQTGQEVNHLVDYIVSGIGYRSIKRLDDLGFTANRVKKALGGVSLQAASMGEVMAAVTQLMDEDMQRTGGYVETSATKVERLTANLVAMKTEFAKQVEHGGFIDWLNNVVDKMTVFIKAGGALGATGVIINESITSEAQKQVDLFQEGIKLSKDKVKATEDEVTKLDHLAESYRDTIAANNLSIETTKKEIEVLRERNKSWIGLQKGAGPTQIALDEKKKELDLLEKSTQAYQMNRSVLVSVINQLFEYKESLKAVNDEAEKGEGDGKRGLLMGKDVFQIVDIRFKNPVTGAISKENFGKVMEDFAMSAQKVMDTLPSVDFKIKPLILLTEWEKAWEANKDALIDLGGNILTDQIDSIMRVEVDRFDILIEKTQEYYDKQIELAGDNERVKNELRIKEDREIKKLEKERADREKKAAKAGIKVSTALGIMKVFTESGLTFADKLIKAAIVAATGASQLIAADRVRYYAKGDIDIKGGTPGKDSIPAMLMPHESVMTAEETSSSHGILRAVRARKLNDKVMQEIVSGRSGGSTGLAFDDSRLLKKLDEVKASQPDIIKRANLAYEIRKTGDNYKKIIRSKSIRS